MFNYRKVLKYLNRAVYVMSAVMMMVGLIFTVLPATEVAAAVGQTCPDGGEWIKVGLNGSQLTYTYTIPAGKQVVEVCYKAGNNTHTYSVSPTTGSIGITQNQFFNDNNQAHGLSHASFRLQNVPTPTNTAVPPTATNTPVTATATASNTPTDTATFTPTATASNTPTNTATFTPTATTTDTPTNTATATSTNTPTDTATPTLTNTPTMTPNTKYVLLLDPYCVSIPGDLMQWTVINNNSEPFTVTSWFIDGVKQLAPETFIVPASGEYLLTQTSLSEHTITLYWEQQGYTELTFGPLSCQLPDTATPVPTNTRVPSTNTPVVNTATTVPTLPIPETGGAGGPIIPVTGADLNGSVNSWFFGGFGMFGFGLVLSGLRKMFNL